ncbi:MAG: O-methyltransferase, partial [bacterium]
MNLDDRVQSFLESRRGTWRDLNVPEVDGRTLRDLILKHKYKSALEIGTSTGHSAIWIAWALTKTGGKLTTIEVDPGRHQ